MGGRHYRDIAAGVMVTLVGLYFFIGAFSFRIGTAQAMGPGYFPMLLGGAAVVLGVLNLVPAFSSQGAFAPVHWRSVVAVLAGIAAFAALGNLFGLLPAAAATVLICALGDRTSGLWSSMILAVAVAVIVLLIFRIGLELQMPAFQLPSFLRLPR